MYHLWFCLVYWLLFISLFATLDNNATGGVFGEKWPRKDGIFIMLINKEKSRDIMLKPGKLLHWACIYIHLFWFTCFTISSIIDLCGVCHESYDFENPFPNYKYIIKTPDIEVSVVYNDFEMNLFYSKTFCEKSFWWDYEPPKFWLKVFC